MKQQMKTVAKKEVKTHEKKMHGMKCGGKVKRYADGGKVDTEHLVAKEDKQAAVNKARDKQIASDKAAMEKKYPPKVKPAKPKSYAKGGGVERKGKTKGKFI
jgi:hypothetical protein